MARSPYRKIDWMALETALREHLRTYADGGDAGEALREIDNTLAEMTGRGNEIPCLHCGRVDCSPECPTASEEPACR